MKKFLKPEKEPPKYHSWDSPEGKANRLEQLKHALYEEQLNGSQLRAIKNWWKHQDTDDYMYMDNERYAVDGHHKQMEAYHEIASRGCCGFCDIKLKCDDGTRLMYGFNYGH